MSTVLSLSRSCINGFQYLLSSLRGTAPRFLQQMPPSTIEIQLGKFRVWCGNLGALQTGYSSLDYRLRESALMYENLLQLLQQLDIALGESTAVVSGERLPFDEESMPSDISEESDDDASNEYFPTTELSMRVTSITDILNNLYRLSYKIRNSGVRSTFTRASLIQAVDNDTGIDLFDTLYEFDSRHLTELFITMRQGRSQGVESSDFLLQRLATLNVLRRKQFRYWERHARKLGVQILPMHRTNGRERPSASEVQEEEGLPQIQRLELPPPVAEQSHLSETNATPYDPALDDRTERETILSLASTALDADGKGIEVPKPPAEAMNGDSFTCPYCWVVCPSKEGRRKSWKSHVIQDLRPYVCTYEACNSAKDVYQSRKAWVDHEEAVHRPSWRCRDHPDVLHATSASFQRHLLLEHDRDLSGGQLEDFANVSKLGRVDDRDSCPICFEEQPFPKGLTNHLANHLERIALFALPRTISAEYTNADGSQLTKLFSTDSEDSLTPEQFEEDDEDPIYTQWNTTEYPPDPSTMMLGTSGPEELNNMLEYIDRFLAALVSHIIRLGPTLGDIDNIGLDLVSSNAGKCSLLIQKILACDLRVQATAKDGSTSTEVLWDILRFLRRARIHFDKVEGGSLEHQEKLIALGFEAFGGLGIVRDILEGILQFHFLYHRPQQNWGISQHSNNVLDSQYMAESIKQPPDVTSETSEEPEYDEGSESSVHDVALDPRYQTAPWRMFNPGEVFKTRWPEPPPGLPCLGEELPCRGKAVLVSFRSFIVVANDRGHCTCV
ncbi:wd40 repeat protein [Fusarium globosum]|uniref:Wd40 repeat protein n=1 Tax=Fusarium globosum TaxID=78864 RepID=A0A8H5Y5R1_9HYPO|nr:wd40 repeat protein [Fusarium globosum]